MWCRLQYWKHSKEGMIAYLKSLLQINEAVKESGGSIAVVNATCNMSLVLNFPRRLQKLFSIEVPEAWEHIDYIRVNHTKFMVTETAAYIGPLTVLFAPTYSLNSFRNLQLDR